MSNSWHFSYDYYNAEEQPLREALCTLGNGYFATRGAFEEKKADRRSHYPGTYLAGGYNRLESQVQDRTITNEDLVNWPNWLFMTFRPENGDWLDLDAFTILSFHQSLDLHQGILTREMRVQDPKGHVSHLRARRMVSMGDPHVAGIEWTLTPENWSGHIYLQTALDGNVKNDGVPRYRDLNSQHLEVQAKGFSGDDTFYLQTTTNQSRIGLGMACRMQMTNTQVQHREPHENNGEIGVTYALSCEAEKPITIEKLVTLFSSREQALSEPLVEAFNKLNRQTTFEKALTVHTMAWKHLWRHCNIEVESNNGDGIDDQLILRFHSFHLLQTVSLNSIDRDIGVPARGWHGEAYRGHIFWDELFIFPFLNMRIPQLTRDLLMYRYRRLEEARSAAQDEGCNGAMFPWQSGSNGREESQVVHLNPESGRWIPDNTHLQRHVNAAIAYNLWQYYEVSQDMEFMHFYGAEMLLSIMQFLACLATYNNEKGRYEIHNVVGPDEYHTQYPDAREPGISNNAYTNFMVAWLAQKALKTLDLLNGERAQELMEWLKLSQADLDLWKALSRQMVIPFHDGDIISQFEGYENLRELNWETYRQKYGDNFRLDRILERENDSPNRYKASKQADVLMLFYLFSSESLSMVFHQLGYAFDPASIPRIIQYYEKRTSHGSSLSWLVHSWVAMRADREQSWQDYQQVLVSDVRDIQGGTTPEGIHLGAMAGTVDLMQRCYAGVEIRDDVLWLNPTLPAEVEYLDFRVRYRGNWIGLKIYQDTITVYALEGWNFPVKVGINGHTYAFREREQATFNLQSASALN